MEINSEQLQAMTTADISSTLMLLKAYPLVGFVNGERKAVKYNDKYFSKETVRIIILEDELNKRLNNIFIF